MGARVVDTWGACSGAQGDPNPQFNFNFNFNSSLIYFHILNVVPILIPMQILILITMFIMIVMNFDSDFNSISI